MTKQLILQILPTEAVLLVLCVGAVTLYSDDLRPQYILRQDIKTMNNILFEIFYIIFTMRAVPW